MSFVYNAPVPTLSFVHRFMQKKCYSSPSTWDIEKGVWHSVFRGIMTSIGIAWYLQTKSCIAMGMPTCMTHILSCCCLEGTKKNKSKEKILLCQLADLN